jgi:energy-coupling factor transport system permease protein
MRGPLFTADNARPWLARLDPRVKLAWVLAVSVAAVALDSAAGLVLLTLATAVVATGLKLSGRGWSAVVVILLLTVWGTIVTQGFFHIAETRTAVLVFVPPNTKDPLTSGLVLSREGMRHGAVQSLRLAAMALAGFTLSLSTSPERLLAALARLHVPAVLGFMTTAALRFLPMLIDEFVTVRQARRLRGYRFRFVGPPGDRFRPYREEIGTLFPVVASSLRKAETLADAITARGFDPRARRTYYPPLVLRRTENAILVALAVGCITIVAAKWIG